MALDYQSRDPERFTIPALGYLLISTCLIPLKEMVSRKHLQNQWAEIWSAQYSELSSQWTRNLSRNFSLAEEL